MANNIDERIVQMQFDNDDFNEGIQSSLRSLDKLDQGLALNNSGKALSGLTDVSSKLNSLNGDFGAFGGVTAVIDNVSNSFATLRDIVMNTVISRFTNQIINAGEQMISSLSIDQISSGWTKYADKTSSVQTIMAATAKDFDDTGKQMEFVNEQLNKLMWFTDETSYNFVDMVGNIGKFTSQGIQLDTSVTAMQGIATWAAISGGNAQSASRAMYNLSQALGLGSVRVQDWMSIENANMATVEFKEQVMETAVELGSLKKEADGTYKTLGGKVVDVASFRENLKDGWFTSDVLIKTLENYGKFTDVLASAVDETNLTTTELLQQIDAYAEGSLSISEIVEQTGLSAERAKELYDELSSETYELGRRSFKAAQEAKTFQEAIDATKDAVSSQWMKSFEIIFGDYEEAKKLWTGLSNVLWDVFAAGGEARNKALEQWKKDGGRNAALEAVSNAYSALAAIAGVAKRAIDTVFAPLSPKDLVNISEGIRDFTASLTDLLWYEDETETWQEDSEKGTREVTEEVFHMSDALYTFRRILQGALSVVGIGIDAFKALAGGALFVVESIGKRSGGLIEGIAQFGDSLLSLRNYIQENDVFGTFVDKFKPSIDKAIGAFAAIIKAVAGLGTDIWSYFDGSGILSKAFSSFSNVFNGFLGKLPEYITKFRVFVVGFINNLRSSKTIQKGIEGFAKIVDRFKRAFQGIFMALTGYGSFSRFFDDMGKKIISVKDAIGSYIAENDLFGKALSGIKTFGMGIVNNLIYILNSVRDFILHIKAYLKENGTVGKVFDSFRNIFASAIEKISPYVKSFKEFFNNFLETTEGSTILAKLFTAFSTKLTGFKNKLKEFFSGFSDFGSIGKKFKNAIDIVKNAIKGFFTTDTSDSESFLDKIKKRLEAFKPITGWFSKIVGNVKANWSKDGGLLRSAFSAISSAFKFIFQIIESIFDWAKNALAGKNINIFTILMGYLSLKGAANAVKSVMSFKDIIDNIGGVFDKLKNGVSGIFDFGKTAKKSIADSFIKIAAAIILIAGAVTLISTISPDRLWQSVAVIVGIGAALYAFAKILDKSFSDAKQVRNISKLSGTFIKIGAALLLLAFAMKVVSDLSLDQIGTGLVAIGGLLLELGIFTRLIGKNASVKLKGLIGLAIGILLLVQAMKQIADMDSDSIVKGLIGVGVLLLELGAFVKLTQSKFGTKNIGLFDSVGLLLVITGILILVQAMKQIATLDTASIIKGLVGVGILMLELAAFMKLTQSKGLTTKSFGLGQGIGLLAVVSGIMILVLAMKQVADMNPESYVRGLVGVSILMIELLAFMKLASGSTFKMGNAIGAIGAVASILILVQAMKQIADIPVGGIVKGLIGLGIMMIELGLFMKTLSKLKGIKLTNIISVIGISASMILIAEAMKRVADIPVSGIIKSIAAFGVIFVAIGALAKTLGNGASILGTVVIMAAIGAALFMMVLAIQALALAGLESVIGIAASLSALFVAIGVSFKLLGSLSIGATISALASLAVAIAGIAGIVAAAGLIAQIPGFEWLMGEGAKALELVGLAIGSFIGGIVGGIGAGISAGFPAIGQNLSDFMTNASAFFEGLDGIDEGKVAAVGSLVDLILKLTAAEFLSGITSFVTGGADISGFATQLPILGLGISAFALSVANISEDDVTKGTNAGLAITGLIDALPKTGGWAQKITGEADIAGFANNLPILGAGIASFAIAVSDMDADAAEAGVNAGTALAGLVDSLPDTGGWMQKITGEADVAGFADKLPTLGTGIKGFADAVTGMDSDAAANGANAGLALAGLVDAIPETGWASKITGEADIEGFSKNLPTLGTGIKGFADAVTGIDTDVATNATAVGEALANLSNKLPKEGGLAQAIFGSQSLGTFGDDIKTFGEAIGEYKTSISGFSDDDIASSDKVVSMLTNLQSKIPKTGGISAAIFGSESLDSFSNNLSTFAGAISNYNTTIADVDTGKMDSVTNQVKNIVDLSNSISGNNAKNIKKNLASMVQAFVDEGVTSLIDAYEYEGQFSDAGISFVGYITSSIESAKTQFATAGTNSATAYLEAISPGSETSASTVGTSLANAVNTALGTVSAYNTGVNFIQGYINGMSSKLAAAKAKAASIGTASLNALNNSILVRSPSRATQESGKYFGEGYVMMLEKYQDKVYGAAEDLGNESVNGINSAIDDISAVYDALNINPTITPVLDLSEVESGSNYISSLLNPDGISPSGSSFSALRGLRPYDDYSYSSKLAVDNKDVVNAVNSLGDRLDALGDDIKNLKLVMDTGVVAGRLAGAMDKELGKQAVYKGRGN